MAASVLIVGDPPTLRMQCGKLLACGSEPGSQYCDFYHPADDPAEITAVVETGCGDLTVSFEGYVTLTFGLEFTADCEFCLDGPWTLSRESNCSWGTDGRVELTDCSPDADPTYGYEAEFHAYLITASIDATHYSIDIVVWMTVWEVNVLGIAIATDMFRTPLVASVDTEAGCVCIDKKAATASCPWWDAGSTSDRSFCDPTDATAEVELPA